MWNGTVAEVIVKVYFFISQTHLQVSNILRAVQLTVGEDIRKLKGNMPFHQTIDSKSEHIA